MATPEGREAFGFFVAIVVAGRERYAEGRAVEIDGTDSLRIQDALPHLAKLIHLSTNQVEINLKTLAEVARQNDSEPWAYLDSTGRAVIRSFFKFNVNRDWGGPRGNSGRPPKKNQVGLSNDTHFDSSNDNQDGALPSPSPSPSPPPGGSAPAPAHAREDAPPPPQEPPQAGKRRGRPTTPDFDALVAKARTLTPDSRFPEALVEAWSHDGRFMARWDEWPPWVFVDALEEYSTAEPPLTVRKYLRFCLTRANGGPLKERAAPRGGLRELEEEPERQYENFTQQRLERERREREAKGKKPA